MSHVYAADGTYTISAVALDVSGVLHPAGNTLSMTALDVAPHVALSQASPGPVEGDPTRPLDPQRAGDRPGQRDRRQLRRELGRRDHVGCQRDRPVAPARLRRRRHLSGDRDQPDEQRGDVREPVHPAERRRGRRRPADRLADGRALTGLREGGTLHVRATLPPAPIQGATRSRSPGPSAGRMVISRSLTGTVNPDAAVQPDNPAGLFPPFRRRCSDRSGPTPARSTSSRRTNGPYLVTLTLTDDDGTTVSQSTELQGRQPAAAHRDLRRPGDGHRGPADHPDREREGPCRLGRPAGVHLESDEPADRDRPHARRPDGELRPRRRNAQRRADGERRRRRPERPLGVDCRGLLAPRFVLGSLRVPTSANEADTVSFSVAGLDNNDSATGLRYAWKVLGPAAASPRSLGRPCRSRSPTMGFTSCR